MISVVWGSKLLVKFWRYLSESGHQRLLIQTPCWSCMCTVEEQLAIGFIISSKVRFINCCCYLSSYKTQFCSWHRNDSTFIQRHTYSQSSIHSDASLSVILFVRSYTYPCRQWIYVGRENTHTHTHITWHRTLT